MDGGVATYDVYVTAVDGGTGARLTDHPEPDSMPAWSPDGRKIAGQSYRDGCPNAEIYVMNADGSARTRLTYDAAFEGAAAWQSLPPIAATDALVRQVDDLALAKNAAKSFLALLREVRTSLEDGEIQDANHHLEAFIHQVEAQRGKTVPTDEANALIAYAESIIAVLSAA